MSADFAAHIQSTALEGRQLAESLMVDTCRITRPDPEGEPRVFNPETGRYTEADPIEVYGPSIAPHFGKCRIQIKSIVANAAGAGAGDREVVTQETEWQGPVTGTDHLAVNDAIEMLTCALDEALVGRKMTVKARHEKTHATARRLRIEEVTG